jgi:hypothetical protein
MRLTATLSASGPTVTSQIQSEPQAGRDALEGFVRHVFESQSGDGAGLRCDNLLSALSLHNCL